jgi:hypothetical protein
MGAGKTVEDWDAWTTRMQERHGNGNGHGASLSIEALRLPPPPTAGDASMARNSTATRHRIPPTGIHAGDTLTDILVPTGVPTPPRYAAGNSSSGDPHPTLPNPDATDDPDCLPYSSSG